MNAKQSTIIDPTNSPTEENYSTVSTEQAEVIPCPRSKEEVYSIAIKLLYLTGDIYLKYANTSKGFAKNTLKALALKQLDRKAEIRQIAQRELNDRLAYFYNNGGPIIEPLVSESQAKEVNGFFNRITANYLDQMDVTIGKASKCNDNLKELEGEINKMMASMLTDLANLYHGNDIRQAFEEIINM